MGLKSEVGECLGERTSHLPKQNKVGRNEKCSYQTEEDAFNPSRAEGRVKEEERLDSPGPCSKTKGFEEDRKRLRNLPGVVVCVCVIKPRVSLSTHGKTDLRPQA